MTDQIPMRSASERRAAATKVLAAYDASVRQDYAANAPALAGELRSLLEVPEVGISEDEIVTESVAVALRELDLGDGVRPSVTNLTRAIRSGWIDEDGLESVIRRVARAAARRAERAALEHWEPADIPSQEFMLRHLGIEHEEYDDAGPMLSIPQQYIQKEVF